MKKPRTAKQIAQWAEVRRAAETPEGLARRSAAMKASWARDRERRLRSLAAGQTPEVHQKRANSLRRPLIDRFWRHTSPEPNSGCWLWLGAVDNRGYGQMRVEGKTVRATHVALELDGRPRTPDAPCALHKCDNPNCVNPDHLVWGTLKDNTRHAIERGRANLDGLALGRVDKGRTLTVACDHCGAEHKRIASHVAKRKNLFCSAACSIAWQKENYTGKPVSSWGPRDAS